MRTGPIRFHIASAPRASLLRVLPLIALSGLSLAPMACRSAFIAADIRNDGDTPIRLIEVDYPSASFGTQLLAPHATYDYRFKVQGSGQISLSFTSNDGVSHTVKGPELIEGQEGRLGIAIDSANHVTWSERLMKAR